MGALPYSLYFVEDGRVHEEFQECLVETGFPADGGQQEYQDHRAPRESMAYKGQHEREESLVREENEVYSGREAYMGQQEFDEILVGRGNEVHRGTDTRKW